GARPLARRRHSSRHQDRRRRIRYFSGPDGGRRPARRADVLHGEQPDGIDVDAAGPGTGTEMKRTVLSVTLCLCGLFLSVSPALAQSLIWPSEFPPRALAARPVNFPPYEMQTLPNGLRVIAVSHHEQPVVSIRLLIGAGSAHDPQGKTGLAHLTAALLDQ